MTFLNYFVSQFKKIHTCITHDKFQSRFLKCWEYSGVTQKRQHKHGDNKRAVVCCRPVFMLMLLIQHYISSYMHVISYYFLTFCLREVSSAEQNCPVQPSPKGSMGEYVQGELVVVSTPLLRVSPCSVAGTTHLQCRFSGTDSPGEI